MKKKPFLLSLKLFLIFYPFSSFAVEILNPEGKFYQLFLFLARLVGSFGVIMLILAGFSFVTAEGDPGKLERARQNIIWGLIGIAIAFMAHALVTNL